MTITSLAKGQTLSHGYLVYVMVASRKSQLYSMHELKLYRCHRILPTLQDLLLLLFEWVEEINNKDHLSPAKAGHLADHGTQQKMDQNSLIHVLVYHLRLKKIFIPSISNTYRVSQDSSTFQTQVIWHQYHCIINNHKFCRVSVVHFSI